MITVVNPRVLLWSYDGKPSPKSIIKFFEKGTDVPKSVKYVEGGTLTQEIVADSSGEFPQVELLNGEYTLKGFTPIDPKNPYPLYPEDYELRSTWDLSGASTISSGDVETVETLTDLTALRAYSGDATEVWVGNRVYIKDALVHQVDNNGTIIVSSALADVVWRMDVTGYDMTSLDWFGVDRTGANDSTAAILTAINAIYSNDANSAPYKLPRTLYIPEGVYMINSDINFTCPVFMEKSVRFGNTSVLPITMTFSSSLETLKTNKFDLNLPGLSKINLRFPNGGHVNLGWFTDDTIDMAEHPYKIDITGPGKVELFGGETRRIGKLETNGLLTFEGGVGSKLLIDEITSGPANIVVSGAWDPSAITVPEFSLSWLSDPLKIPFITGTILTIDRNWDISYGFTSFWSRVVGKLVNGNKPILNNTSGNVAMVGFPNADVEWDSLDCSVHDITWENKSNPAQMNWTGTDGNDWDNYLIYGSNDFSGTTTSGHIWLNKPNGITLYGLNHSGSIGNSFGALKLDTCTFNFTVNCTITSVFLEIVNSTVNTDDPSNGNIVSQNMRLRDSRIHSRVTVANANDLEIEMRGCHFTNQIQLLASTNTVKTIVLTNNEVALCDFLPYHHNVQGWSTDKVSIDISGNWTTDTTGQLVHTKGWMTAAPNADTTLESRGVVDFRKTDTGGSWISNTPFYGHSLVLSQGGVSGPIVDGTGAAVIRSITNLPVKVVVDFWNTQDY